MKVAVGSTNPVKIKAKYFNDLNH